MKKLGVILAICFCLIWVGIPASANTVTVELSDLNGLKISGFQLFFLAPDGTFDYPVETDWETFEMDFEYNWGAPQTKKNFWDLVTAISTNDRGTPSDDSDDIDLVKGVGGVASAMNANLSLNEGILLTMSSLNTNFGINANDPKNAFWDFTGTDGEILDLKITGSWTLEGDQLITVSSVPIPGAAWLLASGLIGFIGLKRRKG